MIDEMRALVPVEGFEPDYRSASRYGVKLSSLQEVDTSEGTVIYRLEEGNLRRAGTEYERILVEGFPLTPEFEAEGESLRDIRLVLREDRKSSICKGIRQQLEPEGSLESFGYSQVVFRGYSGFEPSGREEDSFENLYSEIRDRGKLI